MQISNLSRASISSMIASMVTLLFLGTPNPSHGDIYRFVTIDGVETFTDAPLDKQAKIFIKDTAKKKGKNKQSTQTVKTKNISLDEIVAKTVQAQFSPQEAALNITPRLPPVGGTITSVVGMRTDPIDGKWRQHNGIDIALREGTPIPPAAPGVVVFSGPRSGYGNTVLVEHSNGMITLYAHNSRLMVSPGQPVDTDTIIALSGNTGRSTGPHLHFEAWQAGINVTPAFMPGSREKLPQLQLASFKSKTQFRKETLSDGSVLFTNIPSSIP